MKILVTGGTGVIGAGAIPALLQHGHQVRLLSRRADRDVSSFPDGVEPFVADVTVPESLRDAVNGCQVVVHITGIVDERPPELTYETVNVEGTKHMIEVAAGAGARRFVFISSLGADRGTSDYHRSKLRAEDAVRAAPLDWVILRPGNVYGPGDDVISMLLKLVRSVPAVPMVAAGDQPFQPVWFEDLGQAMAQAVVRPELSRQVLEIAGTDATSTRDVIERLSCLTEREPSTISVPTTVARMVARVPEQFESIDGLMARAGLTMPITSSKLQMLLEGNVIEPGNPNALTEVFHINPTSLDDGLRLLADDLPELLPDEGVGAMERKRFWADIIGSRMNADALMREFCAHITEVMPIEFQAEPGAPDRVEHGATLTAAIQGRGHVQVRVCEVTSDRVTFVTVEGHPLAGTVSFHAAPTSDGALRFIVEIHARASNVIDWIAMRTVGRFAQAMNWRGVVLRVVDLSGGEAADGVQSSTETLDDNEARQVAQQVAAMV